MKNINYCNYICFDCDFKLKSRLLNFVVENNKFSKKSNSKYWISWKTEDLKTKIIYEPLQNEVEEVFDQVRFDWQEIVEKSGIKPNLHWTVAFFPTAK